MRRKPPAGIEPASTGYKSVVLPLNYGGAALQATFCFLAAAASDGKSSPYIILS